MKNVFVAIHGGAKLFGNSKLPGRRLLPLLVVMMSLLTTSAAFAQGSIFGSVTNSNSSIPANGEISFFGYLDDTDEEIRIETSIGAGYDNGNWYDDFQNYLTEAPGNPYDYHFYNASVGQGYVLSKLIPNNSFQEENIVLQPVTWPAKPVGLTGRAISSSSVVISWELISGRTYHVYRRLASSDGSFFRIDDPTGSLANPGVADSFFVDTGVDGTSSYDYLIIAEDASGNLGPHSDIITVNSATIQAPFLAAISPNTGFTVGGEPVTVTGRNFDMAGADVTIGGQSLTSINVVSPFEITGLTPPGTAGSVDVVVTNTASALSSDPLVGGFTYQANNPPVLDPIGPQTVAEGGNLNVPVTASDADGTIPALTTSTLPANATFVDNGDGSGTFDFNPDFTQEGTYSVTFYASDGIATDSEIVAITVTHVNQPPVLAAIGAQSVVEGGNLNFGVSATDGDGEIPVLTTSTLPTNATFVDNGDGTGTFDFNPSFTQAGSYSVTFYADDAVATDSEVVTITVNEAGNQTPVLDPIGAQSVTEGANLNVIVTASDPDATIPALTTSTLPANATFVDNGDGSGVFDFNPDFTQAGTYSITFYAGDGLATDSEVVAVTVNDAGNQDPVLDPIGSQSVTEGANLNVAITASDADGEIPALTTSTLPANASFVDNGDGSGVFDFNPDYTQAGTYPVTFYASDGVATDSEVVTITVNDAGNQDPVLDPIGSQSVTEGANLNVAVTASDADGEIPVLTTTTLPANATFVDNGDGSGVFDFNPDYTQAGTYSITFYASDGVATDSEVVAVTVNEAGNQAPVLDPIGDQSVIEGANLNVIVTASDPDATIPALTTSTLPANATFVDNGDGTGVFDFNPDYTQAGSYPVTFYASDGVEIDSEVVTVTVSESGNQAPVLDPIGAQSVTEGANLNVVVTASDPDATIPALTTSTLPANATFVDNGDGTGVFDFNPDYTQAGTYSITFYADDGVATDSEVVAVTVNDAGNQDPVLDSIGSQTVAEGANLNVAVTASDADGTIPTLTTSTLPANATFVDNGDGSGVFDFNPDFTQEGSYPITFYASDGVATDSEVVTVTVTNTNQAPVLDAIGDRSVVEGGNLNVPVTASDPDGTIPTLTTSTLPANATFVDNGDGSGVFDFNPDFTQEGAYSITFYASDGVATDSEVVTVTVQGTNLEPVLDSIGSQTVAEGANLNFAVTASDADGTIPVLTTSTLPANATFADNGDGTGVFDFNPDFTQEGTYPVTFYASDGIATDSEVVTITVTGTNQPPELAAIGAQLVDEGANLNLAVSAADADGEIPALSTSTLPANATFVDNGDGTGIFDFNPDFTQGGNIYNVTFYATDGVAIDSEVVAITVNEAGNQAPVLDSIGAQSVNENTNINFVVTASDPDLDIPTLTAENIPLGATFVDNSDGTGTFDFTPGFDQAGDYNITFIASDGALADSEVVILTVIDVNRPPVLDSIGPQLVDEGANLNFGVSAGDLDGVIPVLTTSVLPPNATFVDNGDGTGVFDFNPDFTQAGLIYITFYASDGLATDSEVVEITVNDAGNQAPVLDSIGSQMVYETANLNLVVTALDPDGVVPTLSALNLPLNATFVDNLDGTGTFDFTPGYDQAGDYQVTFKAFDGVLVDSEVVSITVLNTNRDPVMDPIGNRSMTEGDSLGITVTASDPDGIIPTLTTSLLPDNATFVDNLDGSGDFSFVPDFTQDSAYNITFYASDGVSADSEVVTITVADAGNQPPVLDSIGSRVISEGSTLDITVVGTDPDGTIPSLTAENLPLNATFVDNLDGTGSFQFIPDFTQAGSYGVTFIVSDGVLADSEMVLITVQELGNQAPIIDSIGPQTVSEGDTLILDLSATDPEGHNITFNYTSTPQVNGISLVDNLDGTGTLTYIPDYNAAGLVTIRIYATDDGNPSLSGLERVDVTVTEVNQPPTIEPAGPFGVRVGKMLEFTLVAHDSTAGEDGVIYWTVGNLPDNATFVDNGDKTATFTFSPDISQVGVDTVRFIAIDDGVPPMSSDIYVEITVVATNQPPVISDPGPQMVLEGGSLTFGISATDADGVIPTLTAQDVPENATFVDNGDGTGTFTFDPNFIQSGLYGVVFRASDGIDTDKQNVLIQVVEAGNQSPGWFFVGTQQTIEKELLEFTVQATDPDSTIPTLSVDTLPEGAVFVDSGNGIGSFTWTPGWTQSGDYNISFFADDGELVDTEVVLVQVLPGPQQAPILDPISDVTVQELQIAHFDITCSDSDQVAPILSTSTLPGAATFTDNQDYTGTFHWQTGYEDAGEHQITFYATDPDSADLVDSITMTVTVLDSNRLPAVYPSPGGQTKTVDEGDTLVFTVAGSDPDGVIPILRINREIDNFDFVDHGDGTGTLTLTPSYTQAGLYAITFIAFDGDTLNYPDDSAYWPPENFIINDVPVAPVLDSIGPQTVLEGESISLEIGGHHPGGKSFDVYAENMPDNSTMVGFGVPKAFVFNPDYTQAGDYTVLFIASDGTLADSEYVNITVTEAGNQIPYFEETTPDTQVVSYGDSVVNHLVATDPDLDSLVLTLYLPPANAIFIDSGNGAASMKFVPDDTQLWGMYLFRYIATDPSGAADTLRNWVRVVAFMRGDSNNDGQVDIADISFLVSYVFRSGPEPASLEAADVNSDTNVDVSDALYLVNFIFRQGPPPQN